jgi:replicative DNA helicase
MRSIASRCRILKNKGLELVVIDYLQLIAPLTTKGDVSREREVAEISRSLKLLARSLRLPLSR